MTPDPSACAPAMGPPADAVERRDTDSLGRVTTLVEEHYDFVWRSFRFLGFDDSTAEDGAQQVMCVLARRVDEVVPGCERSFLFSIALRVAASLRRTAQRHPETPGEELERLAAATPGPDELLDERRAHELLQRVLAALPVELRIVFVLHEIEEMTMAEIARTLGIAPGTAASRLRRGREQFQAIVQRMQAARSARRERP